MKPHKFKKIKSVMSFAGLVLFVVLYVNAFIKSVGPMEETETEIEIGKGTEPDTKIGSEIYEEEENLFSVSDNSGNSYTVSYQNSTSVQSIPLEDFLIGALAANIDVGYETETLKAQAVLLRGNFLLQMQEKKSIDSTQLGSGYFTMEQLQKLWGSNFESNYDKIRRAVEETKGIVAKSDSSILQGSFHAMSAGKTRSGEEVLKNSVYQYLASVSCDKNVESEYYIQKKSVSKDYITSFEIISRDSAGYVTGARVNEEEMGGEQVRELLNLASSNFEIEEREEMYVFITKGIGHGLGFDQYYANYMAKNNQSDYMTLLSYFFKNISFTTYDFDV